MRRIAKTASYWCVHITVAVLLAYLLTGSLSVAMAIGFLEPTVQAVVFYIHEWLWERKSGRIST
ncbi:DUF2061 domain-containing protein [Sandaracinobacter sp. RS1-74]|uniref:DUF2061 domain-containing protein n=1 Tax=Sandaracinobacteroides sayramensis TaxID=2913411 RepID=UPI001EDB172B|nr:DUF2061 domain-containing protein [Sandaracinobacteroides sayramensis]MCG2842546.1 DUF2061 domain-containing protein [Sandaracinobacteroides sayramensis]